MKTRIEHDTMGAIEVPQDCYWGAQTQRSLENFDIGAERFGREVIRAFGLVKQAAAEVNRDLGILEPRLAEAIAAAAGEVADGRFDDQFPLVVWQTGSGTQSNMNANEVIAHRARELLGGERVTGGLVHPNDHVNLSQSSNDVFPTVMHVAVAERWRAHLLPRIDRLRETIDGKARAFDDVVKIGRTHLQDAVPLSLGQELSGWSAQLGHARRALVDAEAGLFELALGGTAVGTGLNAPIDFGPRVARRLEGLCGLPFVSAPNKFAALAGHEALCQASSALRTTAAALFKIANDVRWLASGPRCGLGEIRIPENEPGSSIMPGKVNPTQCEALTMVCVEVFGNDAAVGFAAASGNFELNVFKPLILHNVLRSMRLIGDAVDSFDRHCASGIEPDRARITQLVERSLMLVTALSPLVGYEQAARIAKEAHATGRTLREVALEQQLVTAERFDEVMRPERMVRRDPGALEEKGTTR